MQGVAGGGGGGLHGGGAVSTQESVSVMDMGSLKIAMLKPNGPQHNH